MSKSSKHPQSKSMTSFVEVKSYFKRFWRFIWYDDSLLSWVTSILLAFILIKFIFFPVLAFAFATPLPLVAVVSGSMEHKGVGQCDVTAMGGICMKSQKEPLFICGVETVYKRHSLSQFWSKCGDWYEERNITQAQFSNFSFTRGFNTGDVMLIRGKDFAQVSVGDVIIFGARDGTPIIHRVVARNADGTLQTKGDHNIDSIMSGPRQEMRITQEQYIGTAILRIPLIGNVKLWSLKGYYYIVSVLR